MAHEIKKILFLSTIHGKPEDFSEGGYIAENSSYSSEYGNVIYAEEHFTASHGDDTPKHLLPLLTLAAKLECEYIAFDRDATPSDELIEYEW